MAGAMTTAVAEALRQPQAEALAQSQAQPQSHQMTPAVAKAQPT